MNAIKCFEFLIKNDQTNPKIREEMADYCKDIGLYDDSIKQYYEAI